MTKDILIHQIIEVLERADFTVSNRCNIRPRSFDLAARQDNTLLFCKVLYNIDGLNEETAREMIALAEYLGGYPILVGAKTRDQMLEDSVVYMRYDIPALNVQTLYDYFVESVPPLVSAAPGGLYVSIDGDVLKNARMDISMSLGALASELGVSRRTISKYEEGQMDASIDIVLHLEEILDVALARSIDILRSFEKEMESPGAKEESERATPPNDNILNLIYTLGYDVLSTNQAPFKAVSKDFSSTFLTGVSEYSNAMLKRAHLMSSISDVIQTQSVFIVEGKSRYDSVENTVLIERDELNSLSDADDLETLINERARHRKEN
ncbi:putative transcriptional regulator [Methanococcoides vulcani]|uniref:Putative HTH-type transcriptional regulatory protein SAMN04488587_0756 n=1 Tax=Methanococcoides vulcani TaxID=1353158 RepID=A0A1H9YZ42_9EURY|nr:transcriptional regulator [Methanococcoides vulcani]SES74481.1 putative transcriptional regulator [Methanococcoides vulcani]